MKYTNEQINKLKEKLTYRKDDPMWASHSEISKDLLSVAIEVIEQLQRKPLTDDEIFQICRNESNKLPNKNIDIDFARAIEQAHGIE